MNRAHPYRQSNPQHFQLDIYHRHIRLGYVKPRPAYALQSLSVPISLQITQPSILAKISIHTPVGDGVRHTAIALIKSVSSKSTLTFNLPEGSTHDLTRISIQQLVPQSLCVRSHVIFSVISWRVHTCIIPISPISTGQLIWQTSIK